MGEPPTTHVSLLVRIRDAGDREAWARFVEVYAPLVYGFARRHGLQDADAADLTQEVLRAVAAAAGRLDYDPRRGAIRGWLFTIVRRKLLNFRAARRHAPGTGAQDLLDQLPAHKDEQAALWDQEYDQRLFAWAADQVRGGFQEATWQAFWQTAVEGKSPRKAAAALGLSVGAVYIARSRVLARLKAQIQEIQDE
jgi:RNA polymerase sigma-70 factor (ECF subfamily)